MDISQLQHEIDAILRTLSAAKAHAGLDLEDPAVVALEEIMMAKVAALEAAKLTAPEMQKAETTAISAPEPLPAVFSAGDGSAEPSDSLQAPPLGDAPLSES